MSALTGTNRNIQLYAKQSPWNSTTWHFTTRKFSTSAGLYHTLSTPLGPLSTFEIVHGPHHYWRIRCLSGVWSGTTLCRTPVQLLCSSPTQLTVQDLWDNPAEVADFLNLDSWRQWTRREELLGYHNNNNNQILSNNLPEKYFFRNFRGARPCPPVSYTYGF